MTYDLNLCIYCQHNPCQCEEHNTAKSAPSSPIEPQTPPTLDKDTKHAN